MKIKPYWIYGKLLTTIHVATKQTVKTTRYYFSDNRWLYELHTLSETFEADKGWANVRLLKGDISGSKFINKQIQSTCRHYCQRKEKRMR